MRIEKKVWPEFFQKIIDGDKNFEVRLADFKCRPGDILVLKEWDPFARSFTGRTVEKEVTFVFKTKDINFWDKDDMEKYGFQIMSFR